MKKSIITLCATIVAALFLAGCQKEKNVEPVFEGPTHTLTFTAEKMVDSKTAIDSEDNGVVSYKWIEGDMARMEILELYEYDDNGTTKTKGTKGTITDMTISNGGKSATFTAVFSGEVPSALIGYQAAYAGAFSGTHNPQIPAEQSPLPTTFDPAADVLVSEVFADGREESSFVFNMTRKVSVNKMTLKGLTPGEVISTVTFESDKQHAATYGMLGAGTYTSGVKKLTFTFTENNTVPSSGEFPVYFTTAPVENATFTVSVTTDQTRYRKTSAKTITFEVGKVRRFGVNLSGCEMPDGRIFTLVENVSDLVLGSDVVIAANGSKNVALSITQTTNNRSETDATKSDDYSTIEVSDQVQVFTLSNGTTSGTYAFLCGNGAQAGKYIYAAASNNNYLRSQDNLDANASWTIAITNKEATITARGANTRNVLQYNSGSKIFSCYASGQQTVYIYQAAGLPAPNLSFTNASYTFTLGDSDYTNFPGQALNNPNSISDIAWSSSNTSVATVDGDGVVTFVANATGTTTITATFAGDEFFKAGSASYIITVNHAPATLPFLETFENCDGTMGWSGSGVATGDFLPDYEDWLVENASGADGAAKFGKASGLGSAITPEISYSGNATLTFKAGAWNGNSESTNLNLSVSAGSMYSDASLSTSISSVTMTKGAWSEYTVYLKDLVSPFTVTFEGNAASNSRFFLDDVSIVAGIVQPAASFGATMSNTDNVLAAGGTKTINVTGNVSWTASATNGASVNPSSGTGVGSVTVEIPANTNTSSTVSYTVTVSTTASVSPNSYQFTITQDAATAIGNDGSLEHPYTASEARALALGGDTGSYYISGIVTKIQNQYDSSYGTANFWIDENGTSQTIFECYKIKYFDNVSWVEGNAEIALDDEVIVYGTLTVYTNNNNSTPETTSGYLVSLNGKTKGLTPGSLTATPNNSNKSIAVDWGAATGTTSAISYVVTCGSQTYNASAAGSHTFTMADYGTYNVSVVMSASDAVSATSSTAVTLSDPGSTTKDYYKLVTSVSDITAGTYVIGALRSTSATNNFYFAKASVSSGDWVVSDSYVTVAESNGERKFEIANLPSSAVEFTLTGNNSNGFTISNGSNYLYFTANSNRKLAFAASGSSQKWKFNSKPSPLITGGVYISAASGTYTISENSTATGAIRGYANSTAYRAIYIFKKVNE
ncbi:MAG: BACON domain-containing protein [Bacteroidales bacterium]|nr:BACON domain-containing protein [Bacteroidales bacterium]